LPEEETLRKSGNQAYWRGGGNALSMPDPRRPDGKEELHERRRESAKCEKRKHFETSCSKEVSPPVLRGVAGNGALKRCVKDIPCCGTDFESQTSKSKGEGIAGDKRREKAGKKGKNPGPLVIK